MAQAAIPIGMAIAGSIVAAGASTLLMKKPQLPGRTPVMTRNDAAADARNSTEFRRRRGAGANELTGGGAEASTGSGKTLLGQ